LMKAMANLGKWSIRKVKKQYPDFCFLPDGTELNLNAPVLPIDKKRDQGRSAN
jgi:hypothetical protein